MSFGNLFDTILEIVNLVLIFGIYYYLIHLKESGCKCALTPNFYFLAVYISLTIVILGLGIFVDDISNTRYLVMFHIISIVYFIMTIVFVFVTFGYVIELENCNCAESVGREILVIFAVLRILMFILALVSMLKMMKSFNKMVS